MATSYDPCYTPNGDIESTDNNYISDIPTINTSEYDYEISDEIQTKRRAH